MRRDFSKKQLAFFQTLFGNLEVIYRPKTFVSVFKGKRSAYKYKIVGADSYSIAILLDQKPPLKGPEVQLITFENDYFWINLGGGTREFFERVTPTNSPRKIGKPIDLKRWIGKGNGGLKKMGYQKDDDFIRDIRGRVGNPTNA